MIRIISDSSTLYSSEEASKNNLDISPLTVTINGKTYKELEDIKTEEFIEIINQGHIPTSSQPAIGDVVEIYNKYPNDEIINITMADGLSGTYNSACMAKEMSKHKDLITVINSRVLCGPHRYIVDIAAKLAELNKSKLEIINVVESLINTAKSFLLPNDFKYLVRGGRLSKLAGSIGEIIKIVPVMTQTEDGTRLKKHTTGRSFRRAVEAICDYFKEMGVNEKYKVYIYHACNEIQAMLAKEIISKHIKNIDIEMNLLTPAFTTQGGPGCVAIQVIKKYEFIK